MVENKSGMNAPIGGYFELSDWEEGDFPHKDGILLNTGRNALELILRSLGDVKRIFLPYYSCNAVLEPIKKLQLTWEYYRINAKFEIEDDITLKDGDYIVANNYFGIKDRYIKELANKYGDSLIVDNAQGFLAKPLLGIKSFYSPRKYVGVADGGIAYIPSYTSIPFSAISGVELTSEHNSHLLIRKQLGAEAGFYEYQNNERKLENQPIRAMSDTTKSRLNHINYQNIIAKRIENYKYLHKSLKSLNQLSLPNMESFVCPMVYPIITRFDDSLRRDLHSNKIFTATYWANVRDLKDFFIESRFAMSLVAIPCDQRYNTETMQRIIDIIKK